MIVIDTNVISELMKADPDTRVTAWFKELADCEFHTTVVSLAEIGVGISLLSEGKKRNSLQQAYELVFSSVFDERVLAFDVRSAITYTKIVAIRKKSGRPISVMDAIIASICNDHAATLATRNTTDFENTGVELINPWQHDK